MKKKFKRLAEPLRIGSVVAKNRIFSAPTWTLFASSEGEVTQVLIDHYLALREGYSKL